jgi:aspartyl-tRNA(Asn)/glutamyl-tRNA(Gln) amidotransferase subunit C
MSKSADFDVSYVAQLARVRLTDAEAELFQKQLAEVLQYVEKLSEIDVTHVDATAHAIPVFNVFREDEPRDWFTAEEALQNAPRKSNNLFIVPKVVE